MTIFSSAFSILLRFLMREFQIFVLTSMKQMEWQFDLSSNQYYQHRPFRQNWLYSLIVDSKRHQYGQINLLFFHCFCLQIKYKKIRDVILKIYFKFIKFSVLGRISLFSRKVLSYQTVIACSIPQVQAVKNPFGHGRSFL